MPSRNRVLGYFSGFFFTLFIGVTANWAGAQVAPGDNANGAAAVDPMAWRKPNEMPALQARMEAGAYRNALASAIQKIVQAVGLHAEVSEVSWKKIDAKEDEAGK